MSSFRLQNTAADLEARIRAHTLLDLSASCPWSDEIVFPYYDGLSILNVTHSAAQLLGVSLPGADPLKAEVWGGEMPSDAQRVVVFLTDGLGYLWLNQLMAEEDDIRASVETLTEGRGPVPLTSICPTTTAVALPTMWTGVPPVQHGMLGTLMFLREFGMLGNMLGFSPAVGKHPSGLFKQWGLDPDTFIPVPGVAQSLAAAGVPTHVLLEDRLIGTGLSMVLHRGTKEHHPHTGGSDFWLRLRDVLRQTAGQRCFVNAYWPAVDSLSHRYGAHTDYVRNEVRQQLAALNQVLADEQVQDGRTVFIVVADHGHYDISDYVVLREDPRTQPLADALQGLVAGDLRHSLLQVRDGGKPAVMDTVAEHFADCLAAVDIGAALEAGLYGPGTPYAETPYRLGDVMLLPRLGWGIDEPALFFKIVGMHSGLSDWEVLVPFMWRRL